MEEKKLADDFYSLAPKYRTKTKLQEMAEQELDKAREEGIRECIELLQGLEHYEGLKMIRGLQGLDNHEKREYYNIKKRFKELSKLKTKEDEK